MPEIGFGEKDVSFANELRYFMKRIYPKLKNMSEQKPGEQAENGI